MKPNKTKTGHIEKNTAAALLLGMFVYGIAVGSYFESEHRKTLEQQRQERERQYRVEEGLKRLSLIAQVLAETQGIDETEMSEKTAALWRRRIEEEFHGQTS